MSRRITPPAEAGLSLPDLPAALHRWFVADAGPGAGAAPFSAGVVLPAGDTVAQLASAPLLADVLSGSARHASERYPAATWHADHVVLSNSPFLGGLSLATVIVLAPVVAGGAAAGPGAFVGLAVRYPDIGAMAETAFTLRRETRHEGFCLSLLRIAAPGSALPETLLAMLRANVRDPDQLAGWLAAQVAAARRGAASLAALVNSAPESAAQALAVAGGAAERPGAGDALRRIVPGRCVGTAALRSPREAPDGARVQAEVTVGEGAVRVCLSVLAADHVDPACNAPLAATRAAVLTALSEAAGAPPWLLARQLSLDPGGSAIVNAAYPAAVGQGAVAAFACYEAVRDALRKAGTAAVAALSFDDFAGRA